MQQNSAISATATAVGYVRRLIASQRWRVASAAMLMLLSAGAEGIGLVLVLPLLHAVQPDTGAKAETGGVAQRLQAAFDGVGLAPGLGAMLAVFVLVILARSALLYLNATVSARVQLSFLDDLRARIVHVANRSSWEFLSGRRGSDTSALIAVQLPRIDRGTHMFFTLATRIPLVLVQLLVAVIVTGQVMAAAIMLSLPGVFYFVPQIRRARRVGLALTESSRRTFGDLADLIAAAKLIKTAGNARRHERIFVDGLAKVRETQLEIVERSAFAAKAFDVYVAIILAVVVYWALEVRGIGLPELFVMVFVFARTFPAVGSLLGLVQAVGQMLPAYAAVEEFERRCLAAPDPAGPAFGASAIPLDLRHEIRFEDVTYRHVEGGGGVSGASLSFPAGKVTALVGRSGAGKSTVVDLLLRLLSPQGGRILVDGVDLSTIDPAIWRASIACAPQDVFLFHETIAWNLSWAKEDATDEEIQEALKLAAADDVVAALPDGLDTVVGDRGDRLSAGERQRIALARALLTGAPILVLDETTSALDGETEVRVRDAIARLSRSRTIILVAHRLSTVRTADRIHILADGELRESGDWTELAERPGGALHALIAAGG